MSTIQHSTVRPIESKKFDPTNKVNRIEFATFDLTECTRLTHTCLHMIIMIACEFIQFACNKTIRDTKNDLSKKEKMLQTNRQTLRKKRLEKMTLLSHFEVRVPCMRSNV